MPQGLRPSLYIKDDDYMQSFLHGNFITLTNITGKDISDIKKHIIEPLYISIHSMNPSVRKRIFGNEGHLKALKYLKVLDDSGISMNVQIVLLPDINDGKDLEHTIEVLTGDYNNIESVGIVPVGITKFNKNIELKTIDAIQAKNAILLVERLKNIHGKKVSGKVFLSDEFYIISNTSMPPVDSYGKLLQLNNGIGKSADFISNIDIFLKRRTYHKSTGKSGKKILIITSEYGSNILRQAFDIIYMLTCDNIPIDILEVKNSFFGGNIKVTGLLAWEDILRNICKVDMGLYSKILIPGSIFNNDGLTLDGFDMEYALSLDKNVRIIPEDAFSLMSEIGNCHNDC